MASAPLAKIPTVTSAVVIKIVEGESTLHQITSIGGPILLTVAAIAAAYMAAKTANTRQERQLAHDRQVRRDEHRRDALDEALDMADNVRRKYVELASYNAAAEVGRVKIERALDIAPGEYQAPEETRELEEKKAALSKGLRQMLEDVADKIVDFSNARVRLALRFTPHHPILKAADALIEAWAQLTDSLQPAVESISTQEIRDEVEAANTTSRNAFNHFMNTSTDWLAGKIPPY
jgi:hypothetical protein